MGPSSFLERTLRSAKRLIPKSLFRAAQPAYHYLLSFAGAFRYGFPSKSLFVIGVTGTKGKSTTVELMNAMLEEAGFKTAVAGTIRFKIGNKSWHNMFKMTMPGRFFLQRFLYRATKDGCTHAVIEMTSEGSKQHRYRFVYPDALIFTNLSPEHIESHGSYEKYLEAKLDIGRRVLNSGKPRRIIVANADDDVSKRFFALGIPEAFPYSLKDAEPFEASARGINFTWNSTPMHSSLPGTFNLLNILGAATLARTLGLRNENILQAVEKVFEVPGRGQSIRLSETHEHHSAQDFSVIVDYAHTPDSLKAIYGAFSGRRIIGVLGSTGGGRDKWKRKEMGRIADENCDEIYLTNEDPYDEDPREIIAGVSEGITKHSPHIILDRKLAIFSAIESARTGDAVIISGKGTDPYIMEANGKRTPWSDANVAREELEKVLAKRKA